MDFTPHVLLFPDQPKWQAVTRAWLERGIEFTHLGGAVQAAQISRDDRQIFVESYAEAARHWPDADFVLYAEEDKARLILENPYCFMNVKPLTGVVLVNVEPNVLHLNEFACPYLFVREPQSPEEHLHLLQAIKHHVYRYGDPTDYLQGNERHLADRIAEWCVRAVEYRHEPKHWREKLNAAS